MSDLPQELRSQVFAAPSRWQVVPQIANVRWHRSGVATFARITPPSDISTIKHAAFMRRVGWASFTPLPALRSAYEVMKQLEFDRPFTPLVNLPVCCVGQDTLSRVTHRWPFSQALIVACRSPLWPVPGCGARAMRLATLRAFGKH